MLKKEYEILLQFLKKPWRSFTFKEIKKLSKKKSESYVYSSLNNFVDSDILKKEKIGNVIAYNLNLKLIKAQSYSGFISESVAWSQRHIPYNNLIDISNKIPTKFYVFIVTGSYANNSQNESSDIDIVVIINDSMETKRIYSQLRLACELNIPKMHLYVFRQSEFLQMLLSNEANYGKEIVKNNLILYGAENYYNILSEAIENGFNDKKLY